MLMIFAVSMVMVALLTCLMNLTRTGKALRAVAEDPVTASLLGINTGRLIVFTFFVSGFLGGVAGYAGGLFTGSEDDIGMREIPENDEDTDAPSVTPGPPDAAPLTGG